MAATRTDGGGASKRPPVPSRPPAPAPRPKMVAQPKAAVASKAKAASVVSKRASMAMTPRAPSYKGTPTPPPGAQGDVLRRQAQRNAAIQSGILPSTGKKRSYSRSKRREE